jgi:P-type Ca2+ transporter type 2C
LTVNVSAVVLSFVSAIANGQGQSVLTAVQLLWVNLIQDTFSALALATDPPTLSLLQRMPESKDASLINFNIWKMIIGQSALQLAITFILTFGGSKIFTSWSQLELNTVIFNTYVWLQISNQFNCRRIDNQLNIFTGVHRNKLFLLITCITICGQIIIIFVGGKAFSVTRLNGSQWAVSIILGSLSIPFGVLIRIIPNYFIKFFIFCRVPQSWRGRLGRRRRSSTLAQMIDEEYNLTLVKTVRSSRRIGGGSRRSIRRDSGINRGIELSEIRTRMYNTPSQMEEQRVTETFEGSSTRP